MQRFRLWFSSESGVCGNDHRKRSNALEAHCTTRGHHQALKLGRGLPVGPLKLGDRIGVRKILALSKSDRIREEGLQKGICIEIDLSRRGL
jgi:hypothetical protein